MMKILVIGLTLLISLNVFADTQTCFQPLKNTNGLSPMSLQDSYLLRIHKTLAGELDPVILGDGGIVTATWVAGVQPTKKEASIFFIIFEGDSDHPNTTKIDKSYYRGWPFLLLKASCLGQLQNERQMKALDDLVRRHLNPPRNSFFKFYEFQ